MIIFSMADQCLRLSDKGTLGFHYKLETVLHTMEIYKYAIEFTITCRCMSSHTHVCACTHTHTHTRTQTHTHTHKHTNTPHTATLVYIHYMCRAYLNINQTNIIKPFDSCTFVLHV